MNDEKLTKHWKIVEIQLRQAAMFLHEPSRFTIEDRELDDYRHYVDHNEFELAMDELAGIAEEFGCKSGFWRRLKKVAIQMNLSEKADHYELQFHNALSRDN